MLIKKKDAVKKSNSLECTVWEYPQASNLVSFATSVITGRYPPKGMVCNTKVEEIYYVISGTGVIHSEKGEFKIEQEDVYFFETKEKFYVVGNKLHLALINAPPWYV